MRGTRTGSLLWVLVFALEGLSATIAVAGTSCKGVDANIETENADLADRLCTLVEESVASLAECDLDVPLPVRIDVLPSLEHGCLGLYHCGASRIDVLDPDSFKHALSDHKGPFATIPIEHYYDSILTHELAHAAYEDVICPYSTCPVSQEFIAYSMQVRSLSDEDRASFEAWAPVEPSEAQSYLNAPLLAMSPERFATAAWWHFSQQDAPCEYIGAIVTGDVLLDRNWR
jgi:hypothetical protein